MKLSSRRYWRILGHYHRNRLFLLRSSAQGEFFLSPRGRKDPSAELEATLRAFFAPDPADPEKMQPQCRFPARYAWLKEMLTFDPGRLPEKPCERFQKWRRKMNADSLTMIFASSFVNSPASAFGHTFFRFDQDRHAGNERILDQTLNFAAIVNNPNPIEYLFRGLFGKFQGHYSAMPYYIKVQEYSNLESRDLWEYHLNLPPAALARMVRHAWELGSTWFPYYFLNKNCSYQLLPLLEAADPRFDLTPTQTLYVNPADTVRWVIETPGVLNKVVFRASQSTKMLQRRSFLTKTERRTAGNLVRGDLKAALAETATLPPKRKALVLDAASDFLLYKSGPHQEISKDLQLRESRLLAMRRKVDEPVRPLSRPPEKAPPTEGHKTFRIGAGFGSNDNSRFEEFVWRFGLHDQLDPPRGFPPNGNIEIVGPITVRFDNQAGEAWVHDLTLIDIFSLSPWDSWTRPFSWNMRTGIEVAEELDKDPWHSQYYRLRSGWGLAWETRLLGREVYYALAQGDIGGGEVLRGGYRIGGGGIAGVLLTPHPRVRLHLEGDSFGYAFGDDRPNFGATARIAFDFSQNVSVRLKMRLRRKHREIGLNLYWYL